MLTHEPLIITPLSVVHFQTHCADLVSVMMPQRRRAFWVVAALLVIASTAVPALGEDAALSEDDSEHLEEEKAFLIVRKSATPKETVVGSNMTVVIEVHNAGSR